MVFLWRIYQCTSLRKKNKFEFTIFNYKYNNLLCLWNDFTSEFNYLNWLPNNYSNIILASSFSSPFLHLTNFSKRNQFLMDQIKLSPTFASVRYPKPFTSLLSAIQLIFSKDALIWSKVSVKMLTFYKIFQNNLLYKQSWGGGGSWFSQKYETSQLF